MLFQIGMGNKGSVNSLSPNQHTEKIGISSNQTF